MGGRIILVPKQITPITVLVVDDQIAMRRLICRMLERSHFAALEAGAADLGLTLMESHPEVGLAIVDMVMPGVSGLDLAAELNRRHPGIPILYISGYVASIAMQAIGDHSPDAVLLKPFTRTRLIARVRHLLGLTGGHPHDSELPHRTGETAWENLIEGSGPIPHPYRMVSYRNTSAAYSIAAAHAAILRQAGLPYTFRHLSDPIHPYELATPAEQWQYAMECIQMLGLSVDITLAA
jgi:CheY-like chemotaxis protein